MYSQLPVCDDRHHGSKVHVCKSITLGFGAGLLLATVVTLAVPSTVPATSAAEPSSLRTLPVSTASQSSISALRGGIPVIAQGRFVTHDGLGHPGIGGNTAVVQNAPSLSQPYQQPVSMQTPAGEYSPEQLEFMRRAGKMPSMEQPVQQSASVQVSQGQYSPEQLEFLRRAGKLPNSEPQHQQPSSTQGQYSESQLEFMRRRMENQYQQPTTSWDSPKPEAAQGRRDGYTPYQKQRFN
eukprot:gnl/TRDRNA2_/TRDRNA2_174661_c0_seq1.p1 gnl/TRDRNA2_/TRDRNA2_174661_c0~~gnl/TRDRNA2_/TRDRNA2_174661_c0_seq1.p1  ORF type:complete len:266 (-),score=38.92 gnl/TRDRNA2_/TRDRNA2_174661_c0_seq1:589-1302(-)